MNVEGGRPPFSKREHGADSISLRAAYRPAANGPYLHDGPTPLQGFEAGERKVESVRDVKEGLPFAFRSIGIERRDELRVVGQPIGEIGMEPGICRELTVLVRDQEPGDGRDLGIAREAVFFFYPENEPGCVTNMSTNRSKLTFLAGNPRDKHTRPRNNNLFLVSTTTNIFWWGINTG